MEGLAIRIQPEDGEHPFGDKAGTALGAIGGSDYDALFEDIGEPTLFDLLTPDAQEIMPLLSAAELDGADVPAGKWFAPEDGLRCLRAFQAAVRARPHLVPDMGAVIDDIEAHIRTLNALRREGRHFHFTLEMVPPLQDRSESR